MQQTRTRAIRSIAVALVLSSVCVPTAIAGRSLQEVLMDKGLISDQDMADINAGKTSIEELLMKKGVISKNELTEVEEYEKSRAPVAATAVAATAPAPKPEESAFTVETGTKGLLVKSRDGDFKFGVGGRVQADGAFFFPGEPYGNGVEIRRVRLKGYGTAWRDWDYKVEIDFAEEAELTDGWISYKGLDPFRFKVGHQKVPFSLQSSTSSNWQVFQERALTDAFIDTGEMGRRRLGAVASWYGGDFFTVHTGIFGQGANDDKKFNQSWGTATRVTWAPIIGADELLHFGGAFYYRELGDSNHLRYSARPEAHISGTKLVDTGVIDSADDVIMGGAEFSSIWGPFHAQGEFVGTSVRRELGLPTLNFDGWYVQAGYFLTGESRHYKKSTAQFKRIKPRSIVGQGGWGAWEVAARYSHIDLNSGSFEGGRERNFTLGLNWWANQNVMFRFNYVNAYAHPSSSRTLNGSNQSVNIIEGRAQVVF